MKENVIEFLKDSKMATVTFSQGQYIGRVKRLAEKCPDEVEIMELPETNNGYLVAHIPTRYIKINPPMRLTEKERERRREHAKNFKRKHILE